ncbi:WD40 repeat-like protein [Aureobasidium pullulans]|nr:WD40 repeat-like protein [Aureobasidium pullulans]TIA64095.1 WD40 repeat-like protein [Aureobasidium pullulans]
MAARRKLDHDDYLIGWICPLEVEQIAALRMLDELHERLPQHPVDHNVYNLGSINGHSVVIAGLPTTGNNPAATVVTQLRNTFRSLRFCLLVGIGGGVPTTSVSGLVRLGDVVVSKPTGVHSGAVQYDHGKAEVGSFKRTGFLQPPPMVLLNAAQDLAAHRAIEDKDPLVEHFDRYSKPGLRTYLFPGRHHDHLYQPAYTHVNPELSCEACGCDPAQRIDRAYDSDQDRDQSYITVHRGTVASGELVVKDGVQRDNLARELGILCFEMEAAGALNDFPCLVIRGISDYSDSHKNDRWHGYAAAAAAAYGRQLFFHMPIDEVKKCTNRKDDILNWLTPMDHALQHNDFAGRREPGTGQWLLDSSEFQTWLAVAGRMLYCPGMPGAGKTMLTSIVISHLQETARFDPRVGIGYIYCSFERKQQQKPEDLLASLLKQLARGLHDTPPSVADLYTSHKDRNTRPCLEDLITALVAVLGQYSKTFIVVDALDECQSSHNWQKGFVHALLKIHTQIQVSIFATSRHSLDVDKTFESAMSLEIRASKEDISKYVRGRMGDLPNFISRNPPLRQEIEITIMNAVDGMFLLAQLHMESLRDKSNLKTLKQALTSLPSGDGAYIKAYDEAMKRIQNQPAGLRNLGIGALAWIVYARRPLTTLELQHGLAVEVGRSEFDEDNITDIDTIVSVCAGLVTVNKTSRIIRLAHHTIREYFQKAMGSWFYHHQSTIGHVCVAYLSYDIFSSGFCSDDHSFESRLDQYPFYDYAARYWYQHLSETQSGLDEALLFLANMHKVSACAQVVMLPLGNREAGYSQKVAKVVFGIHLAAYCGLYGVFKAYAQRKELRPQYKADLNVRDSEGRTCLYHAISQGHVLLAKSLLNSGADVNAQGGEYGNVLQLASIMRTEFSFIRLLLDKGAKVNAQGGHFGNALQAAVFIGADKTAAVLLERKADVNAGGRFPSALHAASFMDHYEIAAALLCHGADANACGGARGTALQEAAWLNRVRIMELLLRHGAAVDAANESTSALSAASMLGHLQSVRLLLQNGAEINRLATRGPPTAAMMATFMGNVDVLEFLINAGARIHIQDHEGQTALHFAAKGRNLETVKLLIEAGSDTHVVDTAKSTPLTLASDHEVIAYLIDQGEIRESQDRRDEDELYLAAAKGREALVLELLTKGAHVNDQNGSHGSALQVAAVNGHEKTVRLILDHGAEVLRKDGHYHKTPLISVAEKGNIALVKILIEAGSDVRAQDCFGETALHYAAENGHLEVVTCLLEAKSPLDTLDNTKRTPLNCAEQNNHTDVMDTISRFIEKPHSLPRSSDRLTAALKSLVIHTKQKDTVTPSASQPKTISSSKSTMNRFRQLLSRSSDKEV